jgi:hypothetical protein
MNSAKIQPRHLEQMVYIYIRQSSPGQVKQNLESQDLQYQLVHRAQALGWLVPAARSGRPLRQPDRRCRGDL